MTRHLPAASSPLATIVKHVLILIATCVAPVQTFRCFATEPETGFTTPQSARSRWQDPPSWINNPTADPSIRLITASMQWPDDDQGFANTASDKTSPDRTLPIPNVMTERESFRHQFFDHPLLRRRAKLERELSNNQTSLWKEVQLDYLNYYDLETLKLVAGGALIGAAIANTTLDQQIQDHFQASVRGATSDDWFEGLHSSKELGNGLYTLPIFGAAWLAGEVFDDSAVMQTTGRWGKRTLRSFLVGAPPLIVAQRLTGGSRPNEDRHASHWQPFNDNNGVSGHAFMSALPFINAAKMTDRRDLKTILYAGSLLGPISRVNDEAHYPSQVALGWWLAYVAATAIERTDAVSNNVYIHPYVTESGATGGMLQWRY